MTQPPNATTPPSVGGHIGPYRIDAVLSQGAMGTVYAGTDTRLHRPVAIKVVVASMAQSSAFLARFEREAAVMARLESPHVIAVYDHGVHDGWPYLVSQYAAGGDLARLIRQHGGMPAPLAADICAQVADALAAAHAVGVVHRDVKPENVLLRDDRMDRPHAYLGDFGVAHTDSSGLTQPGSVAGTWNYLAPERAEGGPGTPAGDLYALGCLFYETVTGRAPYTGSDVEVALAHLNREVPQLPGDDEFTRRANVILSRVLAKDPAQRPSSAIEVRDQLQLLSGSSETYAAGPSVRARGRSTGKTVAVGAAAAVLLAAIAGGGVWAATRGGSDTKPAAAAAAQPKHGIVGDFDGDGKGDVMIGMGWDAVSDAFGDTTPNVLFSSTGSGFKRGVAATTATQAEAAGDVDGDGKTDAVYVSGQRGTFQVQTDATGVAGTVMRLPYWDNAEAVFVADVNGDGLADVGIASLGNGKPYNSSEKHAKGLKLRICVIEAQQGGTWSKTLTMYAAPYSGDKLGISVDPADLNGDGNADLVLGSSDADPGSSVLLSNGKAFTQKDMSFPDNIDDGDVMFSRTLIADLNGDRTPEMIAWNAPNLYVFDYDASGIWKSVHWTVKGLPDYSSSRQLGSPIVSDVDGDGDGDLVFTVARISKDITKPSKLLNTMTVLAADPKTKTLTARTWKAPGARKVDSQSPGITSAAYSTF